MPGRYNRGVELRHLRYFTAVARLGNVSRAARELRVAQPSLSRQMRDLEEEVGAPLLARNSRGVELTEAGKVFAVEAQEVMERVEQAVHRARATARGETGELHVGYAPSPTAELLPRMLHAFQNAAPGVRLSLHDLTTTEMLRGLRERSLHVALLIRPVADSIRDLVFEPLQAYPICVAMAPNHRFARRTAVPLDQLRGERLVVYSRSDYGDYHLLLKEVFAPVGTPPRIAEECDSGPSLVAAVEAGRGVAVAPSVLSCLAGGRLKLRPLRPAPVPLVVGFAHLAAGFPAAAERLVATLRSLAQPVAVGGSRA